MHVKVQVIVEPDDGAPVIVENIAVLERDDLTPETLGLTLAEAKELLAGMQTVITSEQIRAYAAHQSHCPECGTIRAYKGQHQLVMRTLFGKLHPPSPRLYTCACQADNQRSFSPLADLLPDRAAPELQCLQAKWASLSPSEMGILDVLWLDR